MSADYGDDSPVNDYVRGLPAVPEASPTTRYLTTGARPLTPALLQTVEVQDFMRYAATGDLRSLAEALVTERLELLGQRRAMVNAMRRFVGLPPRNVSVQKQIAAVTSQLTKLYEQGRVMLEGKSAFADALIRHQTKAQEFELKRSSLAADVAEQEARRTKALVEAAKAERELRRVRGAEDPDDVRIGRREDATDRYREALREIKLREKDAEVKKKEVEAAEALKRSKQEGQRHRPRPKSPTEKAAEEVRAMKEKYAVASMIEEEESRLRQDMVAKHGEDSEIVKQFDSARDARRMLWMERN